MDTIVITVIAIFFVAISIGVAFMGAAWKAWVASCLYEWFVVAQFEYAPPIDWVGMFGLILFINIVFKVVPKYEPDLLTKDEKKKKFIYDVTTAFLAPLVALVIGYFLKSLM